jgi:hypothetical protein
MGSTSLAARLPGRVLTASDPDFATEIAGEVRRKYDPSNLMPFG